MLRPTIEVSTFYPPLKSESQRITFSLLISWILVSDMASPAQFLCGERGKGFVDEVKLGLHHYSVHAEKSFECTHCGEKGNGRQKFLNHMRKHSTQKKVDKCAECQFETQKPGNLKRHMQIQNQRRSQSSLKDVSHVEKILKGSTILIAMWKFIWKILPKFLTAPSVRKSFPGNATPE